MPRMRITDLGRRNLYLTRAMWVDDNHAMIEPECAEAARSLGYAEDPDVEPEPAPRRRGRPPKAAASVKADEYHEKTVAELREEAESRGVELPAGYVKKDDLVEAIEETNKSNNGD